MQSLVPLAAPSGQPQGTGRGPCGAIPLLHELSAAIGRLSTCCPQRWTLTLLYAALTCRAYHSADGTRADSASSSSAPTTAPAARWRRACSAPGAATDSRHSAPGPRRRACVRRRSPSWTRSASTSPATASKTLEPFLGQAFSWLITVCDQAKEACPTIPGVAQAGALEHRRSLGRRGRRGGAPGGVPRGPRHPPRPDPHLHPGCRSR